MSKYIEKVEKTVLPAIRLRQTVVFPGIPTSLELDDACDIAAINSVQENERYVFAVSYKFPDKKAMKYILSEPQQKYARQCFCRTVT